MKIGTLNTPIKHERKIQFENDRANPVEELITTIESMISEICPLDEVAESLIDTLQKVNPSTKEVIVVGNVVMIDMKDDIREVDIAGFGFADLYTSMVAAVLN